MEGPSKYLRKGAWTAEEDTLLRQCIDKYGEGKWHRIPLRAGLNRCRKSCRLRWLNYLKPNIKKGKFSGDEVDLILRLHKLLGNRWSLIAGRLPGRTSNDVKNYWNTNLGKKQEPCSKSKTRKTEIAWSNTTPAQNLDVIRPQPRSFLVNNVTASNRLNGLPEIDHDEVSNKDEEKDKFVNNLMDGEGMLWESLVEESQETDVLNSKATATEKEENLADSSLFISTSSTFDVEEKDKLVNNLMDGESMWWESLLEESQETDVLNSKDTATEKGENTADSSLFNSMSSTFDVEELWSMFDAETGELD